MADTLSIELLCNEETSSLCFAYEDVDDVFVESFNDPLVHQTNGEKQLAFSHLGSGSEALAHDLPCLSEECIGWMFEREKDHLPRHDYLIRLRNGVLDTNLRRIAFCWMLKACAYCNFGDLCLYSAMSYFDRFLSVYELPIHSLHREDGKWSVQLVSVACLSLAAKIEEVYVPSTLDLQAGKPKFLFEAKTLQRVEIVVLCNLKWKIKAYTPCNFMDYFLRKMKGEEFQLGPSIERSLQIIVKTIEGIDFLEFKPSEIAAAVAVYVLGEIQAMDIDKTLSCFIQLDKGQVEKCHGLIRELMSTSRDATSPTTATIMTLTIVGDDSDTATIMPIRNVGDGSVSGALPESPNGVLEASACLSCSKGGEKGTVGSCPSSPEPKRRKLNETITVEDG